MQIFEVDDKLPLVNVPHLFSVDCVKDILNRNCFFVKWWKGTTSLPSDLRSDPFWLLLKAFLKKRKLFCCWWSMKMKCRAERFILSTKVLFYCSFPSWATERHADCSLFFWIHVFGGNISNVIFGPGGKVDNHENRECVMDNVYFAMINWFHLIKWPNHEIRISWESLLWVHIISWCFRGFEFTQKPVLLQKRLLVWNLLKTFNL